MTGATYAKHGSIAVITFSHPPVNTLAHEMRIAIESNLQAALGMDSIEAVVVNGEGRGFCAGAQITEFNTPAIAAAPTAHDIWALIENARKPVIAAIHGYAMGGGLEFAMACHYRVATPEAKLAAPEVKLGLLPGAGGTQRLPRAVGVEKALEMMLTGEAVLAKEVVGTLVDRTVRDAHVIEDAVAYARELVAAKAPLRRLRDLSVRTNAPEGFFADARKRSAAISKMNDSPGLIVDCVEAATKLPFDRGILVERKNFQRLVDGDQSKEMRRAFFDSRRRERG